MQIYKLLLHTKTIIIFIGILFAKKLRQEWIWHLKCVHSLKEKKLM